VLVVNVDVDGGEEEDEAATPFFFPFFCFVEAIFPE
jgi:hypothetical protein